AERAELQPAHEQLALVGRHAEEAADVGPPMRHTRKAEVQAHADLRLERLERRVDIAGPRHGAEALHARAAGAAEQIRTSAGAIARFTLREGLLTHEIEAVVQLARAAGGELDMRRRPFAAVEPPPFDAELRQRTVPLPPPRPHLGPREIEEALALLVDGRVVH